MCISPINIRHPTYDNASIRLEVPCGKCHECLASRRQEWTIRIKEELKDHTDAQFITLTYSDENLVEGRFMATLVKKDLQNWFKRLRKHISPIKIRYYAVGEYGTKTLRPHYHVILFGMPYKYITDGILEKTWKEGHVHVGEVSPSSIHYVTKYHVNKNIDVVGSEPSFALMSRKPAIGYSYIDRMRDRHEDLDRCYYQDKGFKRPLPRYYRDKLYSAESRENINIQLNKIRYDKEQEHEEEFKKNNPETNYYDYKVQKVLRDQIKFKEKINLTNTF